jgi:hypothetical protein
VTLWKHNTIYGIDHLLAGIVGTSILEWQIALPDDTVLCDKEKTDSLKIPKL